VVKCENFLNRKRLNTIKKIQLTKINENEDPLTFDIYCLFTYLNKELKEYCSINIDGISTLMKTLDDNPTNDLIDPLTLVNESIQHKFEQQNLIMLSGLEIKYKMNIKYNIQKVIDCLEKLNEINTYIIFVKFINRISNDSIEKIKRIERENFYYGLVGIVLCDENNYKHVIIFNNLTDSWNYLDKSIDYSNLVVISSYLVYFKRTKDCFELTLDAQLNSYEGSQPLINILNMNAEDELYWNSFINIMKDNPKHNKIKEFIF
jgi:hypothetical protein